MHLWNELLQMVPGDMGLTAALGESTDDPIGWLSKAAGVPRAELDQARLVRNDVAANRTVPDADVAAALQTLDHALAAVGGMHLPG